MLQRRGLLLGLLAAPAIIRTPGLLMPVRALVADYPGTRYIQVWVGDGVASAFVCPAFELNGEMTVRFAKPPPAGTTYRVVSFG